MNIVIAAPRTVPHPGGVEVHVARTAAALAGRGHTVTVVTGGGRHDGPLAVDGGDTVHHIGLDDPYGFRAIPPRRFAETVAAAAGDVVHVHSYHQPHAAVAAAGARGAGVPVVVTGHYHGGGHTRLADAAHPLWRRLAGRQLMETATAVVCVSDTEARLVAAHFPAAATVVVPNGTDPVRPAAPYPGIDGPVALVVARQEAYKHTVVLAAAATAADGAFTLLVAGDGPELDRIRTAGGRHVRVLGRVDDATVDALYTRADVYVTASRHEAFGLGAARAHAAGIPVVASRIDAHVDVDRLAGGGTRFVPVDADAATWAAAITGTVTAGAAGTRGSRPLPTWDDVAAQLETVYTAASRAGNRVDGTVTTEHHTGTAGT